MGYMRHNAIVVSGWDENRVNLAHEKAVQIGMCVSPVSPEVVNSYTSFCVFTDGSKEGWDESHAGDERRDEFVKYLISEFRTVDDSSYLDWVEVQYGDDERITKIIRHSDETPTE